MIHRTSVLFRSLLRAREGLAYLEFAIALPFLLALLMGSIEVTRYILIAQKVEKVAVTLSDVVAQGQTISTANLNTIISAATQVMEPYTFSSNGYVIISSVTQTGTPSGTNLPKVSWQYTGGGTWLQSSKIGTTGGNANLPVGFTMNDKDNVIITEVYYNYAPLVTGNGTLSGGTIYKQGFFKPRLGALSTLSLLWPMLSIPSPAIVAGEGEVNTIEGSMI